MAQIVSSVSPGKDSTVEVVVDLVFVTPHPSESHHISLSSLDINHKHKPERERERESGRERVSE